jgi:hypothetical protein
MTSEFLKWLATALVAVVLFSTLWMAHAVRPEHSGPELLVAHVQPAGAAASAPAVTTR